MAFGEGMKLYRVETIGPQLQKVGTVDGENGYITSFAAERMWRLQMQNVTDGKTDGQTNGRQTK